MESRGGEGCCDGDTGRGAQPWGSGGFPRALGRAAGARLGSALPALALGRVSSVALGAAAEAAASAFATTAIKPGGAGKQRGTESAGSAQNHHPAPSSSRHLLPLTQAASSSLRVEPQTRWVEAALKSLCQCFASRGTEHRQPAATCSQSRWARLSRAPARGPSNETPRDLVLLSLQRGCRWRFSRIRARQRCLPGIRPSAAPRLIPSCSAR